MLFTYGTAISYRIFNINSLSYNLSSLALLVFFLLSDSAIIDQRTGISCFYQCQKMCNVGLHVHLRPLNQNDCH